MPKVKENSRNKTEAKRTTITFTLSPENKKAIKVYAAENETTISALINGWIEKYCKGK